MSSKRNYEPMSRIGQAFAAAEKNDGRLQAIIESENFPLTVKNRSGRTFAHIAAYYGNLDGVRYILRKEPSLIEVTDSFHTSILHLATIHGSLEVVKYLVEEHDADICHLSGRYADRTAVHAAVEFNRLDILKYFVEERKIDFNRPNQRQTIPPLFLALRKRHWDVIEYLVEEKNANVRMLKSNQENILFVIVRENFMSFMTYLLDDKKIDLDVDWKNVHGETAMHVAAFLGRIEMLEYLVEKKHARINVQKRSDRRTPLHYAASQDQYVACKFLIDHGADPNIEDFKGDIAAYKAKDDKLFEYLKDAARSRIPRSLISRHSSLEVHMVPSLPINLLESLRVGPLARSIGFVEGDKSFSRGPFDLSDFHGILCLAKLFMRSTESERRMKNLISFPSSSSIV